MFSLLPSIPFITYLPELPIRYSTLLFTLAVALAIEVHRGLPRYKKGLQRVNNLPGFRSLISPFSGAGFGTPYIPGIYPGFDMPWQGKHNIFRQFGRDVISCVSWNGDSVLYLADADLINKMNANQNAYPKPVEKYGVLNLLGPNLVTAHGDDWRRQQVISRGVFNTDGWFFLWNETVRIFEGMMRAEGYDKFNPGDEVKIGHSVNMTLRVALLAIANAGFGMDMSWNDDQNMPVPEGHEMTFQTALHVVAQSSILRLAVPKWLDWLPFKSIREMVTAFDELEKYIQSMIKDKRSALLGEKALADSSKAEKFEVDDRQDLFSKLVKSSLSGDLPLTDEELQGNIYIYLLAGHETTAHSISYSLALLALWPEKQDEMYRQIMQAMPADGVTSYADYKKFEYVLAVYFETLRMFPPVQQIPKKLSQDTVFTFDKSNAHNVEIGYTEEAKRKARFDANPQMLPTPPVTPIKPSFVDSLSPSSSTSSIAAMSTSTSATSVESDVEQKPFYLQPPSRPTFLRNRSTLTPEGPRAATVSTTPEQMSLTVEKDTVVFISPPAVHYNPKYYPDPYEFKPERFVGKFDQTTFIPFSTGTRICIGRHFSEVESVAFLAYFIKHFSVHPTPAFEGETREQMMKRMFQGTPLITLTPHSIPLTFRRR
ncbi:hypothetical protein FRB90_011406 [Tulasnella sp. 427]|nr:hypothetical protein FRB90_011406 [Tulasnella sp. 427]